MDLVADLVIANRILYDQHVVDAFGHVSVRHNERRDRFLLARSMAPALVTAADILEFDLDGNPLDSGGRAVYLERFMARSIASALRWRRSCTATPIPLFRSVRCVRISCARSFT